VGHGDMQIRTDSHTKQVIFNTEEFEERERRFDEDAKRFFKLFQESTFGTSRAAALEMKNIVKRKSKNYQELLLYHSFRLLIQSKAEMLSWPNSPLLVLLEFVDSNVLFAGEQTRITALHHLTSLLHPSNYSTHVNQLILAKQLIQHGANVNAVSIPQKTTPLHTACFSGVVTNLDFIELLLEEGTDPNAQHAMGMTPLMVTTKLAPSAAKFMLHWPATDINIIPRDGESFLFKVRKTIGVLSTAVTFPDNPELVQHQFLLQQWRDIEEMLVERGALMKAGSQCICS
jgi:ankyrin repeat protein